MLEIILIVVFSKKIAALAQEKGRSPAGYIVMLIGFWIGAEFAAGIFVAIVALILNPNAEPSLCIVWPAGLLGAACGAGLAFLIAYLVPPVEDDRYYHEDFDIHGYPRKRRRSPRKRSLPEDEPYWDRPDKG
jgi:hypothetical protein